MQNDQDAAVGQLIHRRRIERGLSLNGLGDETGFPASTIMRIEKGTTHATADKLNAIAKVLDLDANELLAAAGYDQLAKLPTFTPYLRSKYPDMPDDARADLEAAFRRITKKHGFDPAQTGPKPGEDE